MHPYLRAKARYSTNFDAMQEVGPVISNLEYLSFKATILMIWTDCDREGEYIGSEIRRICTSKNNRLTVLRARFSSLTERELHNALMNANLLNEHIIDAVAARIEVDLRTGAAFTRFLTLFLQNNFGALKAQVISYGTLIC
jgi:DNA topoisomerase III